MARTTAGAVRGILLDDYNVVDEPSLNPFVLSANLIVTRVNACAVAKGVTLSSSELELIERWLAAHAYAMVDQPYEAKKTGDSFAKFQGKTGMRLEATKYGQMAMMLDPSGCLNALGNRMTARAAWLGKVPSEQTDYVDRD